MDIINSNIQNYAEKYTSDESEILIELREKTFGERDDKNMLSGFYQGRLLAMFSKMLNPKRILEVGTYMGYSTLCLAEGLSKDGKIITLDIEPETNEIAKDYWARTDLNSKIESHLGQADEIIPTLDETFDLVFIDADKSNYKHYYDLVFPKMRIGGLIIADNVLWSGDVLNAENGEDVKESTKSLHEYNVKINSDERVSNILVAVRDGLMISRKEKE
ncbi:MAG: O-methyltransferase [Aridibacter sp.]